MERTMLVVFLSALALTSAFVPIQETLRQSGPVPDRQALTFKSRSSVDLCPLCIQFTGQAINQLLNIILSGGVVGTCGKLCQALADKTGSQVLGAACTLLCDIEGVDEFVKLVEKADLDPIYLCEQLTVCPVFDGGDASITQISITPASGPQGERQISFDYSSKKGTGTGEIVVAVRTLDGIPVEDGFLQEPQPAGSYSKQLTLKAEADPNCDPSQGPCEEWMPGNYSVAVVVCNGECGSKHPHSQIYDRKEATFVITP